jgi:hypothetical protein
MVYWMAQLFILILLVYSLLYFLTVILRGIIFSILFWCY